MVDRSWKWLDGVLGGRPPEGPLAPPAMVRIGPARPPDFSEADPPTFRLYDQTPQRIALDDAAERKRSGYFSLNNIVRALGRGVLGVGSFLDEADAATNAFLAPAEAQFLPASWIDLREPTFEGRYNHALREQRNMDAGFDEEHPYGSLGLQLIGGAASSIPLAGTEAGRTFLGLGDTLASGVIRSSATGGGIGLVTGFGNGQGGLENRLQEAAAEAPAGFALGAIYPAVGNAATKAWDAARAAVARVDWPPRTLSGLPPEPLARTGVVPVGEVPTQAPVEISGGRLETRELRPGTDTAEEVAPGARGNSPNGTNNGPDQAGNVSPLGFAEQPIDGLSGHGGPSREFHSMGQSCRNTPARCGRPARRWWPVWTFWVSILFTASHPGSRCFAAAGRSAEE